MIKSVKTKTAYNAFYVLGIIILSAIAFKLFGLRTDGLWYDEIYSASFCNLSLYETIIAVLRFDIHPPAYYLQLNLWSHLFGNTDAVLFYNSIFWSSVTIVLVYVTTSKLFGTSVALIASLFVSFSGSEVYFAQEVRMYSMMGCFALLGMFLVHKTVESSSKKYVVLLIVTLVTISMMHGASLIPFSAILLYYLFVSFPLRKSSLIRIVIVSVCSSLFLLGCLANSSIKTISHGEHFGLIQLGRTTSSWLIGNFLNSSGTALFFFVIILLTLIVGIVVDKKIRLITICFVIWPLFLGACLSLFIRPMWVDRSFSFCAPFLFISISFLANYFWKRAQHSLFAKVGVVVLFSLLFFSMVFPYFVKEKSARYKKNYAGYTEIARYLQSNVLEKDIVYVPDNQTYWAIARYFVGPSWGSVLKIQDPVKADLSERWPQIYNKIGNSWLQKLHLIPEKRFIDQKKVKMVIGWSPADYVLNSSHVWIISDYRTDLSKISTCYGRVASSKKFMKLIVTEMSCSSQ